MTKKAAGSMARQAAPVGVLATSGGAEGGVGTLRLVQRGGIKPG